MKRLAFPIILIGLVFIIFFSIRSPSPSVKKASSAMGDYNFENVVISLLKEGRKEWY